MACAKQLVTRGFILVPVGPVRPAGVCSRHCIALHLGACRGELQVRRESRQGLEVPEVFDEAECQYRGEGGERVGVLAAVVSRGKGTASSFYRPRGGNLQACHTVIITCSGMVHSVVE
jgi:hypothetical protein